MKELTVCWDGALLEGNILDCVENKGQIIVLTCHRVARWWDDPGKIEA